MAHAMSAVTPALMLQPKHESVVTCNCMYTMLDKNCSSVTALNPNAEDGSNLL